MKIEMGESLLQSYLKHIEGCRIVQTNWKTSGKWIITEYDKKLAKDLFDKIRKKDSFKNVFKSEFDQEIKQAEIDVLGLNTVEKSIYGIDVAFHSTGSGLNYGEKNMTVEKVLQKIIRTIFILQSYFKEFDKFNSFFVTPKASKSVIERIESLIETTREIIDDESISIRFICNDDFFSVFVDPLRHIVVDENDTAELFMRSIKLLGLDKRKLETNFNLTNSRSLKLIETEKKTENGMKIGQFVQYCFRKAFEQNLITKDEIKNLQNLDYSKQVFKQNFEVLRDRNNNITDSKGKKRYYADEMFCGDYYLTSQWVDRHWESFKIWLNKINYKFDVHS